MSCPCSMASTVRHNLVVVASADLMLAWDGTITVARSVLDMADN
jgi:hypothetical protein